MTLLIDRTSKGVFGRYKKKYQLPFKLARTVTRHYAFRSPARYHDWYDECSPLILNRNPDKVYGKDWEGWADFLGTGELKTFSPKRKTTDYMSWWECVRWVQANCPAKTYTEWLDFTKTDKRHARVPKMPNTLYPEWNELDYNWHKFLGGATSVVETLKHDVTVFVVATEIHNTEANIVECLTFNAGLTAAFEFLTKHEMRSNAIFYVDTQDQLAITNILSRYCSKQEQFTYIVHNMNEFMYALDNMLVNVPRSDLASITSSATHS